MSSLSSLVKSAALASGLVVGASSLAWADGPNKSYTVRYQCGDEAPKTFVYSAGLANPIGSAPMEAQWYWARTRADKGASCRIVSVNDVDMSSSTLVGEKH